MMKQNPKDIHTATEIFGKDDTSSVEVQRRRSSVGKFKDFWSLPRRNSEQQEGRSSSQIRKEMELTQRRLEKVAFYDQLLQERINDTLATDKERSSAKSEKTVWDRKTQEQKEAWVCDRMMLKEGWGAGVYPEGACGPGMWYR